MSSNRLQRVLLSCFILQAALGCDGVEGGGDGGDASLEPPDGSTPSDAGISPPGHWIEARWASLHPVGRSVARLAYDPDAERLVLTGGQGLGPRPLNDTWSWRDGQWRSFGLSDAAERKNHGMAYDRERGRMVIFGGLIGGLALTPVTLGDTWELVGDEWQQVTVPGAPAARAGHAMVYDEARQQVLVFGGLGAADQLYDDLHGYDGTSWTELTTTTAPPGRINTQMAYDPTRERVLLFGGHTLSGEPLNDLWSWDGATWTELHPEGPAPEGRGFFAMAFDRDRDVLVIHGGTTTWPPFISASNTFGDIWEFDSVRWTQVNAPELGQRSGHALAYDEAEAQLVVFGGVPDGESRLDDTWLHFARCGAEDAACEGDAVTRCVDGEWETAEDCAAGSLVCAPDFDDGPRASCGEAGGSCATHRSDYTIARYDAELMRTYRVSSAGRGDVSYITLIHRAGLGPVAEIEDFRATSEWNVTLLFRMADETIYMAVAGTLHQIGVGEDHNQLYQVALEDVQAVEISIGADGPEVVPGGREQCLERISLETALIPYLCYDIVAEPQIGERACLELDDRSVVVRCEEGPVSDASGNLGALVLDEECSGGACTSATPGAAVCDNAPGG